MYSAREFTNFEDRLPAIAGIAKIISQKWNEDYVAGIWRRFLVHQLAWYRRSGWYKSRYVPSPSEPFPHLKERTGWPSWSWKTAPFAIRFINIEEIDAQILNHEVKLASQDAPFGDVLEATLTLKAKIFLFRRELLKDPKNDGYLILDSEGIGTDSSFRVLLLGRRFNYAQFLVVREGEDNCFERIGVLWEVAKPQNIFKQDWDTVVARTVILR